jgi:hypothetical protein
LAWACLVTASVSSSTLSPSSSFSNTNSTDSWCDANPTQQAVSTLVETET